MAYGSLGFDSAALAPIPGSKVDFSQAEAQVTHAQSVFIAVPNSYPKLPVRTTLQSGLPRLYGQG